eukprot:4748393-Prymnesium_polylepis.1
MSCPLPPQNPGARRRAALFGHPHVVATLLPFLREEDVDAKDANGYTALMLAAGHGHVEATIELLKSGANLAASGASAGAARTVASALAAD